VPDHRLADQSEHRRQDGRVSITTYKMEILFGGHGYADSPEEMFIKLRDAILECGYYVQHVKLNAHYQDVQISQAPDGGLFNNKSIHVFPLRDEKPENDSISE
jgi:hypothetical protein